MNGHESGIQNVNRHSNYNVDLDIQNMNGHESGIQNVNRHSNHNLSQSKRNPHQSTMVKPTRTIINPYAVNMNNPVNSPVIRNGHSAYSKKHCKLGLTAFRASWW